MASCSGLGNLGYYSEEKFKALLTEKCTLLAVTLLLLLWVVVLQVRMFYGRTTINKLVLRPFRWASYALCAKAVFQILSVFVIGEFICMRVKDGKDYIDMIFHKGSVLLMMYWMAFFLYAFCYLAFTASIFVEQRILWYFIYFQVTTPFELLDVKKSEYQKREKALAQRIRQMIGFIAIVSGTLYLVILLLNHLGNDEIPNQRP